MNSEQQEYFTSLMMTKGALAMLEEKDQQSIAAIKADIDSTIARYYNSEFLLPTLSLVSLELGAGVWKLPMTQEPTPDTER